MTTVKEGKAASALPKPSGWNILIALPEKKTETEGGVLIPEDVVDRESLATILGFVLEVGPDCYSDKEKFPTGPWCKKGDWVLFRAYAGTRFAVYGQEFRMISDDTVQAVVEDPQGVKRV